MLKIDNILVPYDFSASAEEALHTALVLARSAGASLHLMTVSLLHGEIYGPPSYPPAHDAALARRLEALVQQHHAAGDLAGVEMTCSVKRDLAAAPALLQAAAQRHTDLIVMGTHGRRGVRRWLLGSVAEEVVRLASCPVLTVGAVQSARALPPRFLVPIDFSTHAVEALRYARHLAHDRGAALDLVHVIEETLHPAFYNTGVVSIYDLQPRVEEHARAFLAQVYEQADGPEVPYRLVLRHGRAAAELVRYAEQEESELVVMATHGLTGLEHVLIGSVAGQVVRTAPCPVFTVKSYGVSLLPPARQHLEAVAH